MRSDEYIIGKNCCLGVSQYSHDILIRVCNIPHGIISIDISGGKILSIYNRDDGGLYLWHGIADNIEIDRDELSRVKIIGIDCIDE